MGRYKISALEREVEGNRGWQALDVDSNLIILRTDEQLHKYSGIDHEIVQQEPRKRSKYLLPSHKA